MNIARELVPGSSGKRAILLSLALIVLFSPMAKATIPENLVGYWKLNVNEDPQTDTSANGYDAAYNNGDPAFDSSNKQLGAGSYDFDGNDDLSAGDVLDEDLGAVTVEAWVYHDAEITTTIAQVVAAGGSYVLGFQDSSGDKLRADVNRGSSWCGALYSNVTVTEGSKWYHVAMTWSNVTGTLKMYLDGVDVGEKSCAGSSITNTTNVLGIGNDPATAIYFTGNIDEVRIWNVERTGAEINTYMNTEFSTGPDPVDVLPTIIRPYNITYNSLDYTIELNVTTNETASSCLYNVNGGANVSMSGSGTNWYHTPSLGSEGQKDIIVYCNDTDDDWGTDEISLYYNVPGTHTGTTCLNITITESDGFDRVRYPGETFVEFPVTVWKDSIRVFDENSNELITDVMNITTNGTADWVDSSTIYYPITMSGSSSLNYKVCFDTVGTATPQGYEGIGYNGTITNESEFIWLYNLDYLWGFARREGQRIDNDSPESEDPCKPVGSSLWYVREFGKAKNFLTDDAGDFDGCYNNAVQNYINPFVAHFYDGSSYMLQDEDGNTTDSNIPMDGEYVWQYNFIWDNDHNNVDWNITYTCFYRFPGCLARYEPLDSFTSWTSTVWQHNFGFNDGSTDGSSVVGFERMYVNGAWANTGSDSTSGSVYKVAFRDTDLNSSIGVVSADDSDFTGTWWYTSSHEGIGLLTDSSINAGDVYDMWFFALSDYDETDITELMGAMANPLTYEVEEGPDHSTSESYPSVANDMSTTQINLTVTALDGGVTDINATLYYDGEEFGYTTKTHTGPDYKFTASVQLPLEQTNATTNDFNWVYTVTNGGATEYNTTEHTQTIVFAVYQDDPTYDSGLILEGDIFSVESDLNENEDGATILMYFWIDDARYAMTRSGDTFYTNISIPEISTDDWNYSMGFNTSLSITYGGDTRIMNTSTESVTVYRMVLTNCTAGSGSTTETLAYYLKDEDSGSAVNGSLDITFDIENGDVSRNYSWEFEDLADYSICIYPTWATFSVDSMAQYEASWYNPRTYYLSGASISNVTQDINLYLGSNTTTTLITMRVLNSLGLPEPDVYINIARYNIGTNTYSTIAIVKSDFDGYAYSYLTQNTVWYRFTLYQVDGVTLQQYGPVVITGDSLTFQLSESQYGEWLDHYGQVAYSCTFPSNTTTCTVTDTSGLMASATLDVKRWSSLGWIDVCDESGTSSSLTLVCDMGNTEGRIYWYELSAEFQYTEEVLESDYKDYSVPGTDYGDLGLILSAMIVLVLAFMGAWRWEVGLAGAGVGFGLAYVLGIAAMAWGSVVSVFIVIAVTIYKSRTT